MKLLILTISVFFLFLGCNKSDDDDGSKTDGQSAADAPSSELALVRTDFMTGLSSPWDLAFAEDGLMFFTEKCRGLSVRRADQSVMHLFGAAGASLPATDLFCEGQSGALGVAVDPNFAINRFIYLYMASSLNSRSNRVVRLTVNADATAVSDRLDIVTDIPYKEFANAWGGKGTHSGGRIRFGPDGFLYITTGDNHDGVYPQDVLKLAGKVLRVDRDGRSAPGNNGPRGGDLKIYTYGHRNVQGISFHPTTGQAFIAEHGPGHSDEVTALVAGGNGGWDPKPETNVTCEDNYCGYVSNKLSGVPTPMTDTEKFPQAMRPSWVVAESAGMGACTFVVGDRWKTWNGALLVSSMASQTLSVVRFAADNSFSSAASAPLPAARMRSLVQAPDGDLYIATDEGAIWKVTPQ